MTLTDGITLFQSRVGTDFDCDFDSTDNNLVTTALMRAAERWSRDTRVLWVWKSALTLTNNVIEYNTLDSAVTADKVFDIYGVHINGSYLIELNPEQYLQSCPNHYNAASQSNFSYYTLHAPNHIRLEAPANSTAAAASDNFVMGFRLHATYTFGSNPNTEFEGPADTHEMIVDRAVLDSSKSYVGGDEGLQRRALMKADYDDKAAKLHRFNLAKFKKMQRRDGGGRTRRITSIGNRR